MRLYEIFETSKKQDLTPNLTETSKKQDLTPNLCQFDLIVDF